MDWATCGQRARVEKKVTTGTEEQKTGRRDELDNSKRSNRGHDRSLQVGQKN